MPLTLTVLRCPNAVAPETRTLAGGEFTVGRGPGVDWVLPDPERLLSKHHFVVAYRGGTWQIADTSTNGTMVNAEPEPIGRGQVRTLRDGDRLKLGAYEIEVRLTEDALQPAGNGFGTPRSGSTSPFADPFAADPFAPPPAAPAPFGDPAYPSAAAPGAAQLPHDFDPLAPDADDEPFHRTQDDHSPLLEDAFRPPAVSGRMPLHGGRLPGDELLPDDWDKELDGIAAPAAPHQPAAELPSAAPRAAPVAPLGNPFDPSFNRSPEPADAAPVAAEPSPFDAAPATAPAPSPFDAVEQPPGRATPSASAAPAPAPAPGDDALLAAFLEGVGLAGARPDDPEAMMHSLGQAFRAMASGLREVLIARRSVKNEFRIEQTMIQARGNNPLKFSAGDDDALAALLGIGRRTDMTAEAAIGNALTDIKLHELATMAAMQAAARTLLEGLDPARLRAQADQGGLSLLPAQRKARAWDGYEALYNRTLQALSDDFDSVFGKAFARAYERAMDDVSAKERR